MNRLNTIGLFAGIFAIAMGAVALNGQSATSFMVSAVPQTQEEFGMIGHVEYNVLDESGAIKQYIQGDNVVVEDGLNCAALAIFDSADSVTGGTCTVGTAEFQYISIGNFSSVGTPAESLEALEAGGSASNGCAISGGTSPNPTHGGEMSRRLVDPTFAESSGNTVVTLELSDPFTFDVNNATDVMQSGIFNAASTQAAKGGDQNICSNIGTADAFAIQDLNNEDGITVTNGDSLSVKWTITVQ
ncbi:hypothetical protein [Nitrosopumilus sp.]|uniref:hypothetical protein n=1 Tax=Nitrosopumilus sp. TaxID=2024843 RepID=UPI00262D9026|nr:hypothetical protein [Nitrosopumilus sp.]